MPTTLTLDDDLAGLLRTAAQRKGKPVAEVARMILQTALGEPVKEPSEPERFRVRPHQGVFAPGVPLTKLNQMADDIDVEAFLARQQSQ